MMRKTKWALGLVAMLGFNRGEAQTPVVSLPKPDSAGWIKLFRGNNNSDFYVFSATGLVAPSKNQLAFPSGPFAIQGGDTIRTTGSPNAQLIFKQPFSHYRVQVQLRWPNSLGNTGMMTKIQENDSAQGGALPRAVEFQGDPNQGMGQIWALGSIGGQSGGTWITLRAKTINHPSPWAADQGCTQARQFDTTAPEIDFGGTGAPCNNLIVGLPGWQQPRPAALDNKGWVTFEAESHGRDTTRHFVDGKLVMQYRNPRIAPRNNANQVVKYLESGLLSLQSEGTVVWYRNFKIMLLPKDPLYGSLYTTHNLANTIMPKIKTAPTSPMKWQGPVLTVMAKDGRRLSLTGQRVLFGGR